ncbi:ABC transporter ATP-binding protein [Chlorogloea sp. CCALA 695]|uniref:ABC transporter ATP-binding protein n=1 Tax=Chlorogloea sp. CCALA 695 TaxID=2107693 RepID=UPI000D06ECA4|nr:ABC transporter ATP-binding protein [Chlorogloea sp. CCALA 695]PSB33207.1 ABC transporter ATP-binding protein [Chlorogloea sp. CCALA 695]
MTENAINTENLCRNFGKVQAVDNLCLQVPRGVVFGFLGANGSGKTTTIRLLLGLLEPTSGCAEVLGYDTKNQANSIRRRTGALLEHPGLYERLSAADNLEFYGRAWRLPTAKRRSRIKELLNNLGLWERRNESVGNWSRGMKQRLAVARAMLHNPPLIFLDEPTAGLDPVAAAALREQLQTMVEREGVTVFLTTHNLGEAEKLCQLLAVIRQGKLIAVGNPQELRAKASVPRIEVVGSGFTHEVQSFLQTQPGVTEVNIAGEVLTINLEKPISAAPLVNLLVQAGVKIEEVRKDSASLEEVFLNLMGADN